MIRIIAATPPPGFAFHRANRSTYDDLSGDPAIRQALFEEQHGLCAYCEQRLVYTSGGEHRTRIEHFHPQHPKDGTAISAQDCRTRSGASQLDDSDTTWKNLVLCCHGEEGRAEHYRHCDVTKSATDICSTFRNPKTYAGPRLLRVEGGGNVVPLPGLPVGAADVVDDILMLNGPSLLKVRQRLFSAQMKLIAREKRQPLYGLTPARRKALRAHLETQAIDDHHPSVALSVAALV